MFACWGSRYDELWMPLICELNVGSTPPMVLPPFDIEWVWFCHTLNPVSAFDVFSSVRFCLVTEKMWKTKRKF